MFEFFCTVGQLIYAIGQLIYSLTEGRPIEQKLGFRGIDQSRFIDKYSVLNKDGDCFGFTMEAARHHIEHFGTDKDDFISKLNDKFYFKSDHFLSRVAGYQKIQLVDQYELSSLAKLAYALDTAELKDSKFIGIGLFGKNGGHQIGIKVSLENGQKQYAIYDPNYGESMAFQSANDVANAVSLLCKEYYADMNEYTLLDVERALSECYGISSTASKEQKYLICKLLDAITQFDYGTIKHCCDIDNSLLTIETNKYYTVFEGTTALSVNNLLHYAALKLDLSNFNSVLQLADIHFQGEGLYYLFHVFNERSTHFANVANYETYKILYEKMYSSQLDSTATVRAYKFIELTKCFFAPDSYMGTLTQSEIDTYRFEYLSYRDTILCHKDVPSELCTAPYDLYDAEPLVQPYDMAYEA